MDFAVLFGPIATGALAAITAIIPIAVPVLVALVGIGVALRLFGKFGVKK